MRKLLLFFVLIFSFNVFAQKKPDLLIIDEDIDSKELENSFQVRRGSTYRSSIPDKDLRDDLFVGVKSVKDWDELKKDILFMDLKSKDIVELQRKYPELSVSELKQLKKKR